MKKYFIAVSVIIILLWIGFATSNTLESTDEVIKEEPVILTNSDKILYFRKDNYKLSMYEPIDSCYIGAYILSNNSINYNIKEFENRVNKSHAIYVYNLVLGNEFPKNWVLECIANMKTPLIVVHPQQNMILNEAFLYDTAKACGELSIPIFIDFYPDPEKYNIFPEDYKNFYSRAIQIFKSNAPKTAFIWSVNLENVYSSSVYYPGDSNVDWVGLNIYEPIYKNDIRFENNIWENINFFYNTYQQTKPIMITQFGCSHYSDIDHTYYIKEAQTNIDEFYTKIKNEYPRIKCINYMDFKGKENYKISDNESIIKTYNTVVNNDYFRYNVELEEQQYITEYFKSAFYLCEYKQQIYISNKTLEYELNINTSKEEGIFYNNIYWYPLDIIKDYNIRIDNNKVYIQ